MRFVDPDHGWLGLSDGLLGTSNGGLKWDRQIGGLPIGRIWAFDAKHAWAQAAGNVLYRTEDGVRWQAGQQLDHSDITEMQFVTPKIGWMVQVQRLSAPVGQHRQTGTILSSTDGGASWQSVGDRSMTSVCFLDERNGWGADGKLIFKTADAGRTWIQLADLTISDAGPWYPTIRCADDGNARVQITEPYAALSHAPYLMFRTNDGGKTWLLEYRELYTLGQATPSDTPQLGSYPSIFDTLSDGSTWVVMCTPPQDEQELAVLSPTGAVRARAKVPFASCVYDATFVDAQHGWIVGPEYHPDQTQSVVIRTLDGGVSWERLYPL